MAITPKDQIDISYFDRRNDPKNYLIDTYLSRSNDGGKTFSDTRVTQSVWDPGINPPISPSGEFIGDYQASWPTTTWRSRSGTTRSTRTCRPATRTTRRTR